MSLFFFNEIEIDGTPYIKQFDGTLLEIPPNASKAWIKEQILKVKESLKSHVQYAQDLEEAAFVLENEKWRWLSKKWELEDTLKAYGMAPEDYDVIQKVFVFPSRL